MLMEKYCFTCGNQGFPDKVCPECGREPSSHNFQQRDDTEKFVAATEAIGVPREYAGVVWNRSSLELTHSNCKGDKVFEWFCSQLEKIHNMFANGKIPPASAIIIAPPKFSKETFAYSCMQFAMDKGFSVAPLLDTVELKRLLVLASENPKYKLYKRIDYDSYVTSDVMFITVTKTTYRNEAYVIIEEILSRRSRLGLPTFFISRYTIKEMSAFYKRSAEAELVDVEKSGSPFKYLKVIKYFEGFGKG